MLFLGVWRSFFLIDSQQKGRYEAPGADAGNLWTVSSLLKDHFWRKSPIDIDFSILRGSFRAISGSKTAKCPISASASQGNRCSPGFAPAFLQRRLEADLGVLAVILPGPGKGTKRVNFWPGIQRAIAWCWAGRKRADLACAPSGARGVRRRSARGRRKNHPFIHPSISREQLNSLSLPAT